MLALSASPLLLARPSDCRGCRFGCDEEAATLRPAHDSHQGLIAVQFELDVHDDLIVGFIEFLEPAEWINRCAQSIATYRAGS